MSLNDMVYKWLVPSTRNKLENRVSPNGRTMQGRKGIGRYAASILGDDFILESVTKEGISNRIELSWKQFERAEYLDQVGVKVDTHPTDAPAGTCISMTSNAEQSKYWSDDNIQKLVFELKRLVSPKTMQENNFSIKLEFDDFYEDESLNVSEEIEPFPILDLFDYRIHGVVNQNGKGILIYESQKVTPSISEEISFDYGKDTNCGELKFDIRVYDRESASIDTLIKRGLKDDKTGDYVSKTYAKQLIDNVNGIGVYRNGFRIRPLGDPEFDWLQLNKKRVQNPSQKIGSDQVSGVVHIQSEELSALEEKSARDGLKENDAYIGLRNVTNSVLELLEERRFLLRRKLGLSRPKKQIEKQLNSLYDYSGLKKSVNLTLQNAGINDDTIEQIESLINAEELKNNNTVEEIRKTIAIYQGQVTVGKIINIVLHEGRRPLNYINGQLPNLQYYCDKFKKNRDEITADKLLEISTGIGNNGQIFSRLFSRLNPLATKRRQKKSTFGVRNVISQVLAVFENVLEKDSINVFVECDEQIEFLGWSDDFYTIFTNLIDNSIFWMEEKNTQLREIRILVEQKEEGILINYTDSGPGISKDLLESGVIFEPEFSTKPGGGSGLGLAISGEAAERNGLILSAEETTVGVHFIITKKED